MENIRIQWLVGAAIVGAMSSLLCVILVFPGSGGSGRKNDSINPLACVECDTLKIQGAELLMEKLKKKTDKDGKEMCCALNSKELSTILLEVTSKKETRESEVGKDVPDPFKVLIKVSGVYLVSSSVKTKADGKPLPEMHYVTKIGRNGSHQLMAYYYPKIQRVYKEHFQAGTFYLQTGDLLTLEMPSHSSVILNKETSYIKATLLGSREKETI